MDIKIKLYLDRAENEIINAKNDFNISLNKELKERLSIPIEKTFFHSVISHCYYAIFYIAKAYLTLNDIITKMPSEHKKTYKEFRKFVKSGKLNVELLEIYEIETTKAETLLNILALEKSKRGKFTYDLNAQANMPVAQESLQNAQKFCSILKAIIENEEEKKQNENQNIK